MVRLYKYNKFTNTYISYESIDYDIFSPMFDDNLHIVRDLRNYFANSSKKNICHNCKTEFENKEDLLHHLRYMGYDLPYNTIITSPNNKKSKKDLLKPNKVIHKFHMEKLNDKLKRMSISSHNLREID